MYHEGLRSVLASVALAALLLVGCDTTLEPFAENNGAYSVRGVLTLTQDAHYIRVKNLNEPISEDAPELDATVTLANPSAGITETLEDSVVVFDGVATYNFRTTQDIQPDTEYRLTVERSDGVTTQATAITPPFTEVDVDPETTAVACDREVIHLFPNVPEQRLIEVRVGLQWKQVWRWVTLDNPTTGSDGTPIQLVNAAAVIARIVPNSDLTGLSSEEYCTLLTDDTMRIAYTHFGPDWPADSVRADPLASDVENGLGLFGAMHRDTLYKTVYVPDS